MLVYFNSPPKKFMTQIAINQTNNVPKDGNVRDQNTKNKNITPIITAKTIFIM